MQGQRDAHAEPELRDKGDTILTAPFSHAEAEPVAAKGKCWVGGWHRQRRGVSQD